MLVDIVFISISFIFPYIIRWNISWFSAVQFKFIYTDKIYFSAPEHYFRLYIFWAISTIVFLYNQRLYKTDRFTTPIKEISQVFRAVAYATLFAGLVVFFLKSIFVSRLVFIFNFVCLFITLSAWRLIKRLILRKMVVKGYRNFNVLIIGIGRASVGLIEEIHKFPYLGLSIIGFLDDSCDKVKNFHGYRVLGKINEFNNLVRQYFIDEVFITNSENINNITQLLQQGKEHNVSIKVIPNPFELTAEVMDISRIGNLPVLNYSIKELHRADLYDKRIMDIIISGLALVLLLPPSLIIAIAIKIYDGGPVFYISKRYGRKGTLFNFYKFRSMVIWAEEKMELLKSGNEKDGPIFKMKEDPRITKIGKLLRKYSLDEFPQFWNVLKGEMSIVGPRPLPIGQIEKNDLDQLKRLEIKPGITGLWQISGRSDASFGNLLRWDIWYINNWNFWLDLTIILKSIPVVIKGRGAY